MQLQKTFRQLEYLDHLIRTRATGNPQKLARLLDISERQLFRILYDLRELGLPIKYSKNQQCYYYSEEVNLQIEITVGSLKAYTIKGNK